MLNCLFFRIFSSVRMKWVWASARKWGAGLCPGVWQGAGCAGDQTNAMLAPPKGGKIPPQAPYPLLPRERESSSISLRLLSKSQSRCWIAILCFLRTSAQRWLFPLRRAHTRRLGKKPHTVATRASRRRTVPAAEGCKDANSSRCYPLTLLLRQTPEPLIGAALRKNAEISLCDFQRPL